MENNIKRFQVNNRKKNKVYNIWSTCETKIQILGFWSSGRPDVEGPSDRTLAETEKKGSVQEEEWHL